jgi:hypothetical protein
MAAGKTFGFLVLLLNQQILERWESYRDCLLARQGSGFRFG